MISDPTTFFLAFAALFAGFGLYLVRIDRQARRLEARIDALELARAANAKSDHGSDHS